MRALEDAAVAAGMSLPPITAPLGSMAFSGRTPSGMVQLPSTPARGLTPRPSDFAGAATLDAGSLPPQSAVIAQVAPPVTGAGGPRRRVWTFIAAAAVPLVGAFVAVMVLKNNNNNNKAADDETRQPAIATQTSPKIERTPPPEAPDPGKPDPDPGGKAGTTGHGGLAVTDDDGEGQGQGVGSPVAVSTVNVTLTGLPAGTSVLDPDGVVLTTAAGGDTTIALTTGTAEVTIGLHHPTLGDNYVMLTPSESLVKAAPKLIPQATTEPDEGGKKPPRPRKEPKDRPKGNGSGESGDRGGSGGGKAPGGDNSDATERPVFKQ